MSTPGSPGDPSSREAGAGEQSAGPGEVPFDPYRYGRPDHPVPPEYAPPGYVPDPPAAPTPPPPAQQGGPWGPPGQYPAGQYPPAPPSWGQPYGQAPVPPPYGTPMSYGPPSSGGTGKATTAMVLGIVSILLCWTTYFDVLVIVPAFVFGFLALGEARRRGGAGRGMARAGIICAIVGALLATTVTVVATKALDECRGVPDSRLRQCVQDYLTP